MEPTARARADRFGDRSAEALPAWITDAFIERTTKLFQPRYSAPLTREDVIRMLLNVGALLDGVLLDPLSRGTHASDRPHFDPVIRDKTIP